eukprot:CAMPEP_0172318204 /NCGR_PEP_ID=MMETSP1058-20130122/34143_1 /TAXON_ID=83371 /ORGANISM="Detonula confervacea, Strain CCMP 353" /LENGTH=496 /DNA_ID=CAMNT_0013032963 /DNA_START=49 /DNA_END=1539 /DNA_ORIENTATION=+
MNSNQQESAAPRVSILVDAGGVDGSSSSTHGGIAGLRATTGQNDGDRGMSPGSEDMVANDNAGPTAIPVDEGDVSGGAKVGVVTAGLDAGADVDTVTPREGDAVNVTNDANADDQEEVEEEGEDENQDEDVADDESEYSYNYEDEDEGHFSGFLIPTEPFETTNNDSSTSLAAAAGGNDDVNVVASEDSAAGGSAAATGGRGLLRTISRAASGLSGSASPIPETYPQENERKPKWREPTRAAVNMSLRAEKEKTGGRRRLASDLYKIMMADTKEAGFSLEPCDEDSMDKWSIKLFGFDGDSNLAKDLMVCGMDHVELEMGFPDQYPFEPPFVRVVKPRFKRQTGFVMSGALCMELLTNDGWNPINDIESVIVSIRSLMVVGDGRLQAAADMGKEAYKKAVEAVLKKKKAEQKEGKMPEDEADDSEDDDANAGDAKRKRVPSIDANDGDSKSKGSVAAKKATGGSYSAAEAQSAYDHLSKYHKKEGWDKSGWWGRKG